MSVRLNLWLGAMACATVLLIGLAIVGTVVQNWMLAGLVVLVLFAPIAWALAWLTYRPVRGITKTTRSITTTGELDRRCFYDGPRDDIGDLVVAVNELLVRYDAAVGRLRRLQAAGPDCDCPREAAPTDPADLVVVDLVEPTLAPDSGTGRPTSQPGS
jgi:hypothetical protein